MAPANNVPRVVFGILAHERLDTLEDMIANIRRCCPGSETRVLNGAGDDAWLAGGVSVPVSARSRRFTWGDLTAQHYMHMLDLIEADYEFDYLVVLDSDMLMIRPGFDQFLAAYLNSFAYLGARILPISYSPSEEPAHSVSVNWTRWAQALDSPVAYEVFNPGQIFRRDLVEHIVNDPLVPELIELCTTSRIVHGDEFLWPTYAISRGFAATDNPGSHAMQWYRFDPAQITLLAADPFVYLVHKVGMNLDDADRAGIHRFVAAAPTPGDVQQATHALAQRRGQLGVSLGRIRGNARALAADAVSEVQRRVLARVSR